MQAKKNLATDLESRPVGRRSHRFGVRPTVSLRKKKTSRRKRR